MSDARQAAKLMREAAAKYVLENCGMLGSVNLAKRILNLPLPEATPDPRDAALASASNVLESALIELRQFKEETLNEGAAVRPQTYDAMNAIHRVRAAIDAAFKGTSP